jgi:hypothetical protein
MTYRQLAPCRPSDSTALALYITQSPGPTGPVRGLRIERLYVRGSEWTVRRGGKLVPANTIEPPIAAIQKQHGDVHSFSRYWRSIDDFLVEHGVDPETVPLADRRVLT